MTFNLRKGLFVLGFILFLSGIAFARPNAKICRNRNGKFPRPGTSCKGYYECRNYVPEERTCSDGEHFNANKGRCDYEELYPCLEKPKDKECPRENGLFLKPGTNCKQYYRCCNGKPKVEHCPSDTLFDPSRGNCEWPDLYTCIENLKWKKCPSPNGSFLKPRTNCKKYYNCTNGKPNEKCCQKNTLFNPATGKCEPSQFYTCVEPPERKECPRRNGQFLKPRTNCRKYYNCSNGEPEQQQCSKNTLFNPSTEKCESSEIYTCIEKPEREECPKRNGNFLKPGTNCMKYYECSNGEPEERKCRIGTLFNPSTENCEAVEKYTCTETPEENKCKRKNGKFLKPGTNCEEYYKCSDGKLRIQKCERNMLFNPSSEKCESSKIYTCVESLSTTKKVSSTVTIFETSTSPNDQKDKTSTDTTNSKSTTQKTTPRNRITDSTYDPGFEKTNSRILETSTKFNTPTPTNGQSTFQTTEIPTTLEPKEISTPRPTTEISTTLELKEISTPRPTTEIPTTLEPKEISTPRPTTEISTTLEPKEISTPRPTTEISTTLEPKEISTPRPTTKIPTTLEPKEISTPRPTTEIPTTLEPKEISTPRPTTEIPTTLEPKEISTKSQSTTSEISTISQTTSPQISSSRSTDDTISKENKEGDITEPKVFETTMEITFSPSPAEVTTSAELNIMCPEPTGHYPHPTDKHKFVACVHNIPYILDCPNDLVYRHHLRRCDFE